MPFNYLFIIPLLLGIGTIYIKYIKENWNFYSTAFLTLLTISITLIISGHFPNNIENNDAVLFKNHFSFWTTFALFFPTIINLKIHIKEGEDFNTQKKSIYSGLLGFSSSIFIIGMTYIFTLKFYASHLNPILCAHNKLYIIKSTYCPLIIYIYLFGTSIASILSSLHFNNEIIKTISQHFNFIKVLMKQVLLIRIPIGTVFTFTLSALIAYYINLENLLPICTVVYLLSFSLINLVAFMNLKMNKPTWRPIFKTYPVLSGLACILCIVSILIINPTLSISITATLLSIYYILSKFNFRRGIYDIRDSFKFYLMKQIIYDLAKKTRTNLSWHPNLLIMNINLNKNKNLIFLANTITQSSGFCAIVTIIPKSWGSPERVISIKESLDGFIRKNKLSCLNEVAISDNENKTILNYISAYGLGPIKPNTVLIPINDETLFNIETVIQLCIQLQKNILFFKENIESAQSILINNEKIHIDIWWNSKARESVDLMLNFISILQNTLLKKSIKITLKYFINRPGAENEVKKQFDSFMMKSRFHITVEVITESNFKNYQHYSINSDIVFVPLSFNNQQQEKGDFKYKQRLKSMLKMTDKLKTVLFIAALDNINHNENFEIPDDHTRKASKENLEDYTDTLKTGTNS